MDQGVEESGRGGVESSGNHACPNPFVNSSKYINGHLYKKSKDVSMQNGNGNGFILGGSGAPIEYETSTVSTSRIGEEVDYFHQNECKGGGIPHGDPAVQRSDIPNGDGITHMNGSINRKNIMNGSDANNMPYNSYSSKLVGTMVDSCSRHHVNGNIDPCHNGSEKGAKVTEHVIGSVNSINESMHGEGKYGKFLGVEEVGYPEPLFDECDKSIQENVDLGLISSMKSSGEMHFGSVNMEEGDGPSEDYHHSSQSNGTSAPRRSEQVPNGYSENKIISHKTDSVVQVKKKKNVTFTSENDVFSISPGVSKEDTFGYYSNGVTANGVISNGVISNGVISNGVISNGVISNGVISNGVISNGVISNGVISNGVNGMPNGGCVVQEEEQSPVGSTNLKKTHTSVYSTTSGSDVNNQIDATGDMYNFITLKQNNNNYHPNSVNNNYIEYDINNNGPFFPSMSSGFKSDSMTSNTFGSIDVGTVVENMDHPPQEGDISSPAAQAMSNGAYSVCSTGPQEWVYKHGSQGEDQSGNVPNVVSGSLVNGDLPNGDMPNGDMPNGDLPNGDPRGETPISENPVNEQEAKGDAGGATYFPAQVPNASDTAVNAMYDSSSYRSNGAKWKDLPLSGESMNTGTNGMSGRGGTVNKNDKSAPLNGKVKQMIEQHKGNARSKNVSFSKKLVFSKSKEKIKMSNYPSNVVNPTGGINQPHRFINGHPHTLSANMPPMGSPPKRGVHTTNMSGMYGISQGENGMVDMKNEFLMRYLSDVEKMYQIRERIKQYEKKVSKNRTNVREGRNIAGDARRSGNSSSLINYYNILELLYRSSVKKKNMNDKRIRTLLYVFKYIKNIERRRKKKKKIYLFDATTLHRLNKQVDLYIDFVERREYRSDLAAHLRRWDGILLGEPDKKETISLGGSEVKPSDEKPVEEKPVEEKPVEEKPVEEKPVEEKPVEEKVNDKRQRDGGPRAKKGIHMQSKFIQNLLKKKSNLYCSSPGNVDQVHSESFYFQHALKQVNYLSNLLVYMHFILLKYVSIFSLSEWNALLFRDIDSFNCGQWGRSTEEVKEEIKEGADKEGADKEGTDKEGVDKEEVDKEEVDKEGVDKEGVDKEEVTEEGADKEKVDEEEVNVVTEQVTEPTETMNDAPPVVASMATENEKSTSANEPGEFRLDAATVEKLNPLRINRENTIDINYYEYVIEPFDFFFYENVYNEICTYVEMGRNSAAISDEVGASNATAQLLKNLPYQYYEFVEILKKEIMNVRDLIYRNRYIRYIFYYIYRNNNHDLLNSVNHIFQTEKKKIQLYKLQMKMRYNIFLSRFFEHEYVIVKCPSKEKRDEEFESCGLNFIEAKEKLFRCLFGSYREYYCAYQARIERLRGGMRRALGIPDERFPYLRKKIAFYSELFEDLKRRFADRVNGKEVNGKEVNEQEVNDIWADDGGVHDGGANEWNMCHPHDRKKLTFDVAYQYVEYMFQKKYALIINSEKNNSRKLKAAYIVKRNLKDRENLIIVTSVLNIIKWKSLFQTFENVTVYLNEESILENKIQTEEKNLIICVDFLPKIIHVPCDVIILDMSHFNLLNRISILNDLRFLNFSRRIIIMNNVLDENWSLLSSLFFLNSSFFDNTIISRIQLSQSEEDKKILGHLMRGFVEHFCVINREKIDSPHDNPNGQVVTNPTNMVVSPGMSHAARKKTRFLITYMSGIQKFIYDKVNEEDKLEASVHPLLLLDENNFFLKDFNISEKFDLLKNIIKKFHMLRKRILLCYSGRDKLEKLIKMLLYVNLLNDTSIVTSFDIERDKDSINVEQYDVAVVVNNHVEYLTFFKDKDIACYLLISAFTKEEEEILDTFKHKKEVHFYKKRKEELMRSGKSCRDSIYRYYINNMLSENDEQFLLFNIIDQKEKVYCNTSYDEVVLPTCFVSTLTHCEEALGYSEHWQDIKNAHSFWNFNNFNRDKVIFYLDRKNTVYDKYQNVVCPISEEYISPPQIYYYLTNPMNEKNTFNNCLSLAIDEIIQEMNRKKELDEFDEMKKMTLLNIKEKASKKYFSSIRKVEKILSEFLNENKKKSFERFLKGCESYGQVITKCKEKLFVTFNKTYNIHFKYFEDFWLGEEKERREKWRKLWDLHEAKEDDNRNNNTINNNSNNDNNHQTDNTDNHNNHNQHNNNNNGDNISGPSGENNLGNGADTSGNNNDADDLINSVFNTTVNEKNDTNDKYQANNAFAEDEKTKNEINFLEKRNFRIRLSSQLFDEKEFDQLFMDRKRICLPNDDNLKDDNNSCSLEEKKEEKDKKTCLYIERKESEEPCHV
ncbi:conserved Plasmodium protein, unknown function [Plasmodium knowlesi strain H]|uniref:Uncharacterized protein n=1 Tax=Plasmodium knowlesi (strain H) TaxID=5851 RepID=A0A193QPV1_PLAKH|nr:conserved Plasmodium protein, unknown function [Plasmodium knowlesi strain H]